MLPADPAGAVGAEDDPAPGSGPTVPVRPLTFRELLDVPFALVQANIGAVAKLAAAGLVVAELFVMAVTAGVSVLTDGSDDGIGWAALLSTLVAAWALRFLLRGTTVALGLADVAGHRIGWSAALDRLWASAPRQLLFEFPYTLFWTVAIPAYWLLLDEATALGVVLLVLMAFFVPPLLGRVRATRYAATPVIHAERADRSTAAQRAKLLVAGKEWSLTGLWLAHRGLLVLLMLPVFGLWLFVADFSGTHLWTVITLTTTSVLVFLTFGEVVEAATRVVAYLDMRCRREGLDIKIPELR
ncbi:hypothetical protein ACFVMC_05900 [Nocardia sp. NPDC127579]|uniref:hypothetical protein n=1 Tax=Nocardia sp. NPDC127579 TaxID=3345402 RepID=UPI00362B8003